MTDKPNCSTCPHLDESTKRYCTCRKINQQIDGEDMGFVARIGCLSHPGAREYLVKDVIKELERRTKLFGGHYGVAYQSAIFLIRDGVKA